MSTNSPAWIRLTSFGGKRAPIDRVPPTVSVLCPSLSGVDDVLTTWSRSDWSGSFPSAASVFKMRMC